MPCQDISSAGLGRGITEGTRSGLWFHMAGAVRTLRPRLVVVENVSALLVRGLNIVLGDLADIGYDAQWVSVRASDVGAPHRRHRVFLTAHPADTDGRGSRRLEEQHGEAPARLDRPPGRHADRRGVEDPRGPGVGVDEPPHPDGPAGGPARCAGEAVPQPRALERPGRRGRRPGEGDDPEALADSQRCGLMGGRDGHLTRVEGSPAPSRRPERGPEEHDRFTAQGSGAVPAWGPYAVAVHRWELVLGRPAPLPTDDRGRLSPHFVEWMMGLDPGWVTDHLDRRPALKALGNGVVPQQAAHALRLLDEMRDL